MSVSSSGAPHDTVAAPAGVGALERAGGVARRVIARWQREAPRLPPAPASWPPQLRRLRRWGLLLLAVELALFMVWNATEVDRFSLTQDFAGYVQAIHLLLHGNLHVDGTAGFMYGNGGQPTSFWKTVAELDIVPLAIAYWVWPHLVVIKWIQSLALIGAQAVAFIWMCELAAGDGVQPVSGSRVSLPALGLLLMVLDPWFVWSSSFDFHSETIVTFLAVGVARDLYFGRRRAWFWAAAGILCSAVGATYIATVAAGAIVSGRGRARLALAIGAVAVAWFILVAALHLVSVGGPLAYASIINGGATDTNRAGTGVAAGVTYGKILGVALHHPLNVVRALWANHANLWAPVSAAGILGILWPPALVPAVVVLLEGGFARGFSIPSFQNIVIAPLIATGTVAILLKVEARTTIAMRRRVSLVAAILLVNSITWATIWFPRVQRQWIDVSSASSRVLAQDLARIGPGDEVVVSQGVAGPFADRDWVYTLTQEPMRVVLAQRRVWFVMAPDVGIEIWTPSQTLGAIGQLEHTRGVRLIDVSGGIWLFQWTPPRTLRAFTLGSSARAAIPGSQAVGTAGVARGSGSGSYASSTGAAGYVSEAFYTGTQVGAYRASVRLSATIPVTIQVWDYSRSRLLGEAKVRRGRGVGAVILDVHLRRTVGQQSFGAVGPWSIEPIVQAGDAIGVRVRVDRSRPGAVRIYSVGFSTSGAG
jgi:hypothetical protein